MNTKEMILSIVTALVIVAMIAVMIGPASAGTTNASKLANRTECPIGGVIEYTLEVTNNDPARTWAFTVYDQYANDGEIWVADVTGISPEHSWTGTITFPVEAGDESSDHPGYVFNQLRYTGKSTIVGDTVEIPIGGNCGEFVRILIDLEFTYAATCCMGATVTPEWSGPVAWHQWIIDGTTYPVIYTAPTPKDLTSCGSYVVTLKGGPDTDNLNNYKEFSDTVDIACEPIVDVKTNVTGCVRVGDPVEFSIDSLTYDTPIASYHWTFTNGLASSNNPTVTRTIPVGGTIATLKVTDDLDCYDSDTVSVSICPPPHKPTSDVPILTPTGMVALIGMLCIVGAGRILTKGRRL